MRRILVLLATLALALALTAPVAAAPSQRFSDVQTILICEGLTTDDGTVFLFAGQSATFGELGDLAFWLPGSDPQASNPDWVAATSELTFDAGSISGVFALYEFTPGPDPEDPPIGDPVGEAVLSATLTPDGPPVEYDERGGDGNAKFRRSGTAQAYTVSGTVTLPGELTFHLSGCEAFTDDFTEFSNNPASHVARSEEFQLNCTWEVGDTFVGMFVSAGDGFGFADLFVSTPDGELSGGFGELVLTETSFEASWDLMTFDPETGVPGDVVGAAEADATLTATNERFHEKFSFDRTTIHQRGEIYAVDGTLNVTTPDGSITLPMDAESCLAADITTTQHDSARKGPRGRPLPNDAPEGAVPLAAGDSVTVRTGGAAAEGEEPCIGQLGEDVVEFPIGRTGWWTFEGTGEPMTVDTAGSDFDTVVGVYVEEGGALVPIGCVDDTENGLQAAITVETTAGEMYWIQAGGLGDLAGTLVLSLE
jgi:hypothetical protein